VLLTRGKENLLGLLSIYLVLTNLFGCGSHATSKSQTAGSPLETVDAGLSKVGALPTDFKECRPIEMQFVDKDTGWITCEGNLWRTSDGGNSWEHIYFARREDDHLTFYFIDAQNGWATSIHTLLKTDDGGRTWRQLTSPTPDMGKGASSRVIFLKDGKTGWLAGAIMKPIPPSLKDAIRNRYIDGKNALTGAIFFTENGGESWRLQKVSEKIGSWFFNLYLSDPQTVWASGEETGIFHSEKGKWVEIDYDKGTCDKRYFLATLDMGEKPTEDSYDPHTIYFVDSTHGWMSFPNGYMAKTNDGGATWCDLLRPNTFGGNATPTYLKKIYFTDSRNGWALSSDGNLLHTIDGGLSWTRVSKASHFDDMYFLDANHGWVVSKEGLFRINYPTH
jgi:photosystem II stability/assembly factor-like uncharacterized protein